MLVSSIKEHVHAMLGIRQPSSKLGLTSCAKVSCTLDKNCLRTPHSTPNNAGDVNPVSKNSLSGA